MRKTISLGLVLALVLAMAGLAQAATVTVGSGAGYDFDTIQAGIDAANGGDTVRVAAGEYVITEPITFRGKAITVMSEAGPDETTIRMGTPPNSDRGSVVVFENNETAASVLDGFTITEGIGSRVVDTSVSLDALVGGAIFFNASSGSVRNCTIVQSSAEYSGGLAVYSGSSATLINCAVVQNTAKNSGGVGVIFGSSATLTNCIIEGNSATGVTMYVDGFGGGLGCAYSSSLALTDCTITRNSAGISSGAAFCGTDSSVTMTNCTIAGNTSQRYCGVLECAHGSTTLTNCLIARNTGAWNGGALGCVWSDSSMAISNCTIWGNRGGTSAGGVGCWHGSSVTVTNSIISGNTAPVGREIEVRDSGSTLDIVHSDVAGGQNVVSVEGGSTLNWGAGNIDANPCFADPNSDDYHLRSQAGRWGLNSQTWIQDEVTSPCIDAGDPMSPIGLEPFPTGGFVNMGAYGGTPKASKTYFGEPVCGTIVAGDINGDCQVNRADLEIMALHWTDEEPLPMP